MSLTLLLGRATNAASRAAGRHRWLRWLPTIALATGLALSVHSLERRADAERRAWGDVVEVWVAERPLTPGDAPAASRREVPVAVVPPTALPADALISGRQVRRGVGVGEILTSADVVDGTGPLARLPDGWRAVPVREGVASGAAPGERVDVASEGLVLVADAIVLERRDGVTLVAVPGDLAATIAFADTNGVTLLRSPVEP